MAVKSYWPQKNSRSRTANRDFGRRRFGNPLFRPPANKGTSWHQRQQRRHEWHMPWRLLGTLVVLAGIGYGLWYILWSEAFRVREVAVAGASPEVELAIRHQVDARLASRIWYVFPQNNLLLFSTSSMRREIETGVYLETLAISKRLPSLVTVTVKEKEPKVAAAVGKKLVVIDAAGAVIRELTEGERIKLGELPPALGDLGDRGADTVVMNTRDFLPGPATVAGQAVEPAPVAPAIEDKNAALSLPWPLVVLDEQTRPGIPAKVYEVGDKALPPEAIVTVLAADQGLKSAVGTTAKWYTSRPSGETVEVQTAEGWSAYLSTAKPVESQLNYLREALARAVGKRRPDLLYIDVRYNEKVFAKFREEPADQPTTPKSPAH